MNLLYNRILADRAGRKKSLAWYLLILTRPLLLPAKNSAHNALDAGVDYLFVGSSILTHGDLDACVSVLKQTAIFL
ncbi:MAG: hypothetical protein IPP38_10250 [Bacteroidetes bacterium]|nr:hypothetical protein [Bacteroidota bacterium]